MLLTYLASTPAYGDPERRESLLRVRLGGACALAIQRSTSLAPGDVVHYGQALPPEDGGAVRYGEDGGVDEDFEGGGPVLTLA